MTTVQIVLPDALVQEAATAELLAPENIERILCERLRADRFERMKTASAALEKEPLAPMTSEEIIAEIDGYRAEQRRAAPSAVCEGAPFVVQTSYGESWLRHLRKRRL